MNSDTAVGMFIAAFGMFFFVFALIAVLIALGFFVLKAFGLYRIAQRKNIDHAWLAWIPFAQTYLYAEIIGQEITVGTLKIKPFPWIFVAVIYGASFAAGILSMVPVIGWFVSILLGPAVYIVGIYVMYRFFQIFEGDNAVVYTVICTIFPIVFPVLVLVLRDKPFAAETVTMKQV